MKRLAALLIALLLFTGLGAFPVLGQGQVVLNSSEVRSQFPDGVAFEASAQTVAPDTVTEIKLEMKVKGATSGAYAYLDFAPETVVTGKYLLKTGGALYKPPGSLIEYRYIIRDSAGHVLETPTQTFLYMDNRFQWEKVSGGQVEVYYYGAVKARAELILQASQTAVSKMGALLGVTPGQTIRIIGYNTPQNMASALPFTSQASQTQLLVQGQAWYEYNVLLELISDALADGVAGHELTHMLVREAAKGAYVNLPSWLNEGLAEYGNGNPGVTYDSYLAEAVSKGTLLPIRHMQSPPGIPKETLLFYGESRSIVKYLVDTYGDGKLRDLFGAFRQGLPIDAALNKVYGFDQDGLDNAWRASLGLPPLQPAPAVTTPPSAKTPAPTTPGRSPAPSRPGFGCAAPVLQQ